VRGLRDAADRLAAGPVPIAYLGNSVTAQKDGYRPYLHAGLVKRFRQDHKAVNAGFGGVGSIGSVCTMDDLVIRHSPALCFIECMTGDMGIGLHADTGPALEGMLKKLAMIGCAACFLNLPRRGADFSCDNSAVALYARVATHYGTASIDLGPKLRFEGPDFFRDVVHTTATGSRRTADLILGALDSIFLTPSSPPPSGPLFARDYREVTVLPMSIAALRDPAACTTGRFRLTYPFVDLGPDNEIFFHSTTNELLGLLVVIGPHSGPTIIGGEEHQLRDRWTHYDRLHAYVLDNPLPADRPLTIAPVNDARDASEPPPRLKIIGFLVRPVSSEFRRQLVIIG
jgi:hypothetical protein